MEHRATSATYVISATTASLGALTANEVAAVGGLLLAFATFCVNWYYRHKHYKLAERKVDENADD